MQVDFYLLNEESVDAKNIFACRLLEKTYRLGHSVFVFCDNIQDTHNFDELLWSFRDDSFIPHNIQGEGPEPPPAIQIGHSGEPRGFNDVLLNLSPAIPEFYPRFSRIIEIVANDNSSKDNARKLYREYKKQGLSLKTHNING